MRLEGLLLLLLLRRDRAELLEIVRSRRSVRAQVVLATGRLSWCMRLLALLLVDAEQLQHALRARVMQPLLRMTRCIVASSSECGVRLLLRWYSVRRHGREQ